MKLSTLLPVLTLLLATSCKGPEQHPDLDPNAFYTFSNYRVPAEWEPAKGVMFACPPVIPKNLIIEFAKDTHIYPIVENDSSEAVARKWFTEWGIDMTKVTFITLPDEGDAPWLRDWGPSAVFDSTGTMYLADVDFKNSDPFTDLECNDSLDLHIQDDGTLYFSPIADHNIDSLGKQLGMPVMDVPVTLTGGNMLTDGVGTALSTCILTAENRFNGVSDEDFFKVSDSLLGLSNYHIVPNFEEYGIQHIDCLLKLVNENTLLVAQPPKDHPSYPVVEYILTNHLSKLKNSYGKPYIIKRIPTPPFEVDNGSEYLPAYSNSLILNHKVYVPLYGVETDSLALQAWREALPGYTVKGFEFFLDREPYLSEYPFDEYREYDINHGWAYDDALHCRTRAVWDPEMLFVSVNKPSEEEIEEGNAMIYATVKNYGGKGEDLTLTLHWRNRGETTWNEEPMKSGENLQQWYVAWPEGADVDVEYLVKAVLP